MLALAEHTGAKFNLIPLSGGKNTIAGVSSGEMDFGALPFSGGGARHKTRALLIFDDANQLMAKLDNAPTRTSISRQLPPLLSSRAFAIKPAAIDKYPDRFKILQETPRRRLPIRR